MTGLIGDAKARRLAAMKANPARPTDREERRPLEVFCMADVEPEEVEFLWYPYLPVGKLSLLEGDPGQGKSTVTAALATSVSLGRGFPGGEPFEPGSVLLMTAEDGLGDTLRPRLDRMRADVARIHAIEEPVLLATEDGRAAVEDAIRLYRPRLVCIDPIVAYLGATTDTYRAPEVRAILAPLSKLAEKYGCALLAVRHLTKARHGTALHAGQGSVDFVAAARSLLLVGRDPSDEHRRALVHTKCNLAALGPSQGYRLDPATGFEWTGPSSLTASDLLGSELTSEERSVLDEAKDFICELLEDGPLAAKECERQAEAASIANRTLKRAKKALGVVSRKDGLSGSWHWFPPDESQQDSKSAKDAYREPLAPLGDLGTLEGSDDEVGEL